NILNNPVNMIAENKIFLEFDSNLWYDYDGFDADYNGIGDIPYTVSTFQDLNPRIWLNGYRLPLVIDGDSDLVVRALAEGWRGSGVDGDPFVFENYHIIGTSGQNSIILRNMESAYLSIQNCYFEGGEIGIQVESVAIPIDIRSNTFFGNQIGIGAMPNPMDPFFIPTDSFITAEENRFYENGYALYQLLDFSVPSEGGSIFNLNLVTGSQIAAIYIENAAYAQITSNGIIGNDGDAIHLFNVRFLQVEGNNCTSNGGIGLLLEWCSGSADQFIRGNIFSDNEYGLYFDDYTYLSIVQDNIIRGRTADAIDYGVDNLFERNMWWSYHGPDDDFDEFGDIPHLFTNNMDLTPRMGVRWTSWPIDVAIEAGQDFEYPLWIYVYSYWSDLDWFIGDTDHFSIDENGVITNIVPLSAQEYWLEVMVKGGGEIIWAFTLTVTPGNLAVDDDYSTDEDMALFVDAPGILGNDLGVDAGAFVSVLVMPDHGTLTTFSDGSFSYIPDPDWNGIDSFSYQFLEGSSIASNPATVKIEVFAVNDLPVAMDDYYEVGIDATLTIVSPGVLLNDSDIEGDQLEATLVNGPTNGVLELLPDGSFTYTPAAGWCGTDSFTYRVYESLSLLEGNTATVTIQVLDTAPPTTSYFLDRLPDNNGWYLSSVTVTLSSLDVGCGVDEIYYSLDGITWTAYIGPFSLSTEGANTVHYYAVDFAGNEEASTSFTIYIDTIAPVTTAILEGEYGSGIFYRSDVNITLSSFDTTSGIALIQYSRDLQTWFVYIGKFPIEGEGEFVFYYRATDNAGNVETYHTQYVSIDKTAPVLTIALSGPEGSAGWFTGDVLVTFEATDDFSGIDYLEFKIDELFDWYSIWPGYGVVVRLASVNVSYRGWDAAGNYAELHQAVLIDVDAPTSSASFEGTAGTNGWWLSDVTVTLEALDTSIWTDIQSGVDYIEYSFDGNTWTEYIAPFDFTLEEETYFYHRAIDVAGNIGPSTIENVKIDKTAPATILSSEIISGLGVNVTLSATDSLSGVARINYSLDGTTWSLYVKSFVLDSGPVAVVYFYAIDNAGNIELLKMVQVELDVTPPETTYLLAGALGLEGWYVSFVNVTLIAIDDFADVEKTVYSFDGTTWNEYTGKFGIQTEGVNRVYFYSTDSFGNIESMKSIDILIDVTPPETSMECWDCIEEGGIYYAGPLSVFSLSGEDPYGSGLDRIEYRVGSGDWIVYEDPFHLTVPGIHIVYYRGFDVAGNEEDTKSVVVIVNASKMTYTGQLSGVYSDPAILEATLFDFATGMPLEGMPIKFILGSQVFYATTDSSGIASLTIIIGYPAGVYSLSAIFEGDSDFSSSSDSVEFTVFKESAFAWYTGYTVVASEVETTMLRATVFDDADGYWGDLTRINVTFTIYSIGTDSFDVECVYGPISVELTDIDGVGIAVLQIPTPCIGEYFVIIGFDPNYNIYYTGADSSPVVISVVEASRDFVTGGGWICDPSGGKGTFAFVVKYKKNGLPTGNALYMYREGRWQYIIKSDTWIGLGIEGKHAFFEATGIVFRFNIDTGRLEHLGRNFLFRIDIWDQKKADVFHITIYDENGLVFHQAGDECGGLLKGGSIKIHSNKMWCHCHWDKMRKKHCH
ncbi:MAG: OmpL47-type beta-barrel domain-containing protein, partial [Candidatus Thorarchaeota archaeon]